MFRVPGPFAPLTVAKVFKEHFSRPRQAEAAACCVVGDLGIRGLQGHRAPG
ncbi:MAG: hypothetical protein JWM99_2268 [Verrucomicrobiales bacterium]|nr:hypothetical protein [Verrucomicrobiales bacterium]